jgi:hypothetical protein
MLSTELQTDQEQREQNGKYIAESYLDGKADGAFGDKVQCLQDDYWQGYCDGFKERLQAMPVDRQGRIQYQQHQSGSELNPLWEVGAALRAEWRLPDVAGFSPDEEF